MPSIKSYNFSINKMTPDNFSSSIEELFASADPDLQILFFVGNSFTSEHLSKLESALLDHPPFNLKALRFGPTGVSSERMAAFVKKLAQVPQIKKLAFNNGILTLDNMPQIFEALLSNENITELDLSNNNFNDPGCKIVCNALKKLPQITSINISSNRIGAIGFVQSISPMLQDKNCNLISFDLSDNQIDSKKPDTGENLRDLIISNKKLIELNLNENELRDETIVLFSEGLKHNSSLRRLYIKKNRFGEPAFNALCQAKEVNHSIVLLEFDRPTADIDLFSRILSSVNLPSLVASGQLSDKDKNLIDFTKAFQEQSQAKTNSAKQLDACVRRDARREFLVKLLLLCMVADVSLPANVGVLILSYYLQDSRNERVGNQTIHYELKRDINELCDLTYFVFAQHNQIKDKVKESIKNGQAFKIFKTERSTAETGRSYSFSLFPPNTGSQNFANMLEETSENSNTVKPKLGL